MDPPSLQVGFETLGCRVFGNLSKFHPQRLEPQNVKPKTPHPQSHDTGFGV